MCLKKTKQTTEPKSSPLHEVDFHLKCFIQSISHSMSWTVATREEDLTKEQYAGYCKQYPMDDFPMPQLPIDVNFPPKLNKDPIQLFPQDSRGVELLKKELVYIYWR
jgi:hypothetical protein